MSVTLQTQLRYLEPFTIGTPRQFLTYQGEIYCLRANPADPERKNPSINPCEGCPHFEAGCEIAEERAIEGTFFNAKDNSITGIEPHSRRGIGIEERPFLVLLFKEGQSHQTMPQELWDNPFADKAMHEANLHFVLTDPKRAKFHTIKGQLRYYGSEAEFLSSAYAEYLSVFDDFQPEHRPVSLDLSAIEPRLNTIQTREPAWLEIFKGTPKTIAREVVFKYGANSYPHYVLEADDGKFYCSLDNEMDKTSFEEQCSECPLVHACKPVLDLKKNVPGDWHSLNRDAFFQEEMANLPSDKEAASHLKKKLRDSSKTTGLAITYGATEYSVARSLGCGEEEARIKLDNFLSALPGLRDYLRSAKERLEQTGFVYNLFHRRRDMRRWLYSNARKPKVTSDGQIARGLDGEILMEVDRKQAFKDKNFAVRVAYNYPIQGLAAEFLKMAKILIDEMIQKNGWNPLSGMAPPLHLSVGRGAYKNLTFALLSTIHDELLNLIRDDKFEEVIPPVYGVMQLDDFMRALKTGFTLEMDCESDTTRSWTATRKFHSAKIYLLRYLRGIANNHLVESIPPAPNVCMVSYEDCSYEFGAACDAYEAPEGVVTPVSLILVEGDERFQHPKRFDAAFLEEVAERTRTKISLTIK